MLASQQPHNASNQRCSTKRRMGVDGRGARSSSLERSLGRRSHILSLTRYSPFLTRLPPFVSVHACLSSCSGRTRHNHTICHHNTNSVGHVSFLRTGRRCIGPRLAGTWRTASRMGRLRRSNQAPRVEGRARPRSKIILPGPLRQGTPTTKAGTTANLVKIKRAA